MKTVNLHQLNIGGGLRALTAWPRQSPLVLVEVKDEDGTSVRARLDLGKLVFIDPVPGKPTSDGIQAVANAVAEGQHY